MYAIDLFLLHVAATWALVGLIWTVQVVQYPAFALVGAIRCTHLHEHHFARITWVAFPLMACELLTGLALLWVRPSGISVALLATGLALIAVNWAWTAAVAVPLHQRMSARDIQAQSELVTANWGRTVA